MNRLAMLALQALVLVFAACLFAGSAQAAAKKQAQPYATAGKTIKTEYFSVTIPDDWMMPQKVQEMPEGVSAVFGSRNGVAVTVNVLKANMSAAEIAAQTAENMRKGGLNVSDAEKVGDLYRINIKGTMNGVAWFGANGKICVATIILGAKLENAAPLLKALKPVDPELYPKP